MSERSERAGGGSPVGSADRAGGEQPPVGSIDWRFQPWSELGRDDLYEILAARSRVFVVEQNCPYLDMDGHDAAAWHLWTGAPVQAYLRVLPPGATFEEVSLGRIITAAEARRGGLGKALVAEGLRRAESLFGKVPIR